MAVKLQQDRQLNEHRDIVLGWLSVVTQRRSCVASIVALTHVSIALAILPKSLPCEKLMRA